MGYGSYSYEAHKAITKGRAGKSAQAVFTGSKAAVTVASGSGPPAALSRSSTGRQSQKRARRACPTAIMEKLPLGVWWGKAKPSASPASASTTIHLS